MAKTLGRGRIGYVQTCQTDAGRAEGELLGGAEAFFDRIVIAEPGTVHHRAPQMRAQAPFARARFIADLFVVLALHFGYSKILNIASPRDSELSRRGEGCRHGSLTVF